MSIELKALGPAAFAGLFVVGATIGISNLVAGTTAGAPTVKSVVAPTQAQLAKEIITGQNYFASSCSGCHGSDGDGEGDAPSLRDEDMSDSDIADTIRMGSGRMPPFGQIYNAQHIHELVLYIRTLK